MTPKRHVLLVPGNATSLRELTTVANLLAKEQDLVPVVVMQDGVGDTRDLDSKGIAYVHFGPTAGNGSAATGAVPAGAATTSGLRSGLHRKLRAKALYYRINDWLRSLTLIMCLNSHLLSRRIDSALGQARRLCDQYDPAALLMFDDRTLGAQLTLLWTCHRAGVPVILMPLGFPAPEGAVLLRKGKRQFQASGWFAPLLNRVIARRYPGLVRHANGEDLLFYSGGVARALSTFGLLPSNPWVIGGSGVAWLAVDGVETRDRYVALGADPGRIVVVGQPNTDTLFRAWQARATVRQHLEQKYAMPVGSRLIVCAVPHLGEHNILPWDRHWAEVRFLVSNLCGTGQNVLLSLHPKSNVADYRFLEREYGCSLASEALNEFLPAADLFVATFSSTVRWAVATHVPTAVVDFYGFDYTFYDDLPGLVKITERAQLQPILEQLTGADDLYLELSRQLAAQEPDLVVDGKTGQRLAALIRCQTLV